MSCATGAAKSGLNCIRLIRIDSIPWNEERREQASWPIWQSSNVTVLTV